MKVNDSYRMQWVRAGLRKMWLKWPPRYEVIAEAKVKAPAGGRAKNHYLCAICEVSFPIKDVEVDHYPVACGSLKTIDDIRNFADNLFCSKDNLRVVCKRCHVKHTHGYTEVDMLVSEFKKKPVAVQKDIMYTLGATYADMRSVETRCAFYRKHVEQETTED